MEVFIFLHGHILSHVDNKNKPSLHLTFVLTYDKMGQTKETDMSGMCFVRVFLYGILWVVAGFAFQEATGLVVPWYVGAIVGGLAVIVSWEGD